MRLQTYFKVVQMLWFWDISLLFLSISCNINNLLGGWKYLFLLNAIQITGLLLVMVMIVFTCCSWLVLAMNEVVGLGSRIYSLFRWWRSTYSDGNVCVYTCYTGDRGLNIVVVMIVSMLQLASGDLARGTGMGQGWTVALLPAADSPRSSLCLYLLAAPGCCTLPSGDPLFGGCQHPTALPPWLDHHAPHIAPLCHPALPGAASHLIPSPDLWHTLLVRDEPPHFLPCSDLVVLLCADAVLLLCSNFFFMLVWSHILIFKSLCASQLLHICNSLSSWFIIYFLPYKYYHFHNYSCNKWNPMNV